jgi:hypothetical protein
MPTGQYERGLSFEERFAAKVDLDGPVPAHCPELGQCHVWTGPSMKDGTGRLKVDGKMVLARRLACGAAPELDVSPLCRNPRCVRRSHMHVGPRNSVREARSEGLPNKGSYASKDWKDIPEFPGYEASRHGEIRSWRSSSGSYAAEPHVLTPTLNRTSGYYYVMLMGPEGKKNCLVHLLILRTWKGQCPPGHEARHFPDNDRSNNSLGNLSYTTHQRNMDNQVFHGTRPTTEVRRERMLKAAARGEQHYTKLRPEAVRRGSAHGNAKLTPEGYDEAVALLRRGTLSQKEIANLLGVSQAQISDINTGKRPR